MRLSFLFPVLPLVAACGPDARIAATARLAPPLALEVLTVTVRDGSRGWRWDGSDFRVTGDYPTPHTAAVGTRTRGEIEVGFRLQKTDSLLSEGAVTLLLREDWQWGVDIVAATTDPKLECFGCVGSRAFPLAASYRPAGRDSVWLVWGGNYISHPVIY